MTTEHKVFAGIGILTLVILVSGVLFLGSQNEKVEQQITKSFVGTKVEETGSGVHVKRGESHAPYNSNPPSSGPHWGDGVAGAGIHDEVVPDELLVHSLEHGAAIVWYQENLPKNKIEQIKEAFNASYGKKIMVPRKNLDVPVALTSWGWILKLESIDNSKIKEFIETNNDRAPEKAAI